MSTVWKVRQRLLQEELERLAERLGGDKPPELAAMVEHTVRLLTVVVMLIRQHHVNTRGQCDFCGWPRWGWRFLRPRCTVFRALSFAMDQSLDVVWWQLFTSAGKERSLAEVRKWVAEHSHAPPQSRGSRGGRPDRGAGENESDTGE